MNPVVAPKPKKLTKNILQNCLNEMSGIGLVPTPEQLRPVLEREQDLVKDLLKWYKKSDGNGGLDTADRELVHDAVCIHLVGEMMPMNMQGAEYAALFYERLMKAAKTAGWKTTEDE